MKEIIIIIYELWWNFPVKQAFKLVQVENWLRGTVRVVRMLSHSKKILFRCIPSMKFELLFFKLKNENNFKTLFVILSRRAWLPSSRNPAQT